MTTNHGSEVDAFDYEPSDGQGDALEWHVHRARSSTVVYSRLTRHWRLLLSVACAIALTLGITIVFRASHGEPADAQASSVVTAPSSETVTVDVHGDVVKPGVYHLPYTARTGDAIRAAGGYIHSTDAEFVNEAAPLDDGAEITVPLANSEPDHRVSAQPLPEASAKASQGIQTPTVSDSHRHAPQTLIDPNTATLESLETLPGIGPAKAQAIIDYRQQHGAFQSPEELQNIHGIGPSTLSRIVPFLLFPRHVSG